MCGERNDKWELGKGDMHAIFASLPFFTLTVSLATGQLEMVGCQMLPLSHLPVRDRTEA